MTLSPTITAILNGHFRDDPAHVADVHPATAGHPHENLKAEVERLYLVVEALWVLLKKTNGLNDRDLVQVINQVDMRDGRLDNKASSGGVSPCSGCGKSVQKGAASCMYCGKQHQFTPFENR